MTGQLAQSQAAEAYFNTGIQRSNGVVRCSEVGEALC